MIRVGCLAHVRRKFRDTLKLDSQDRAAAAVLLLMGKLYAVEKEARAAGATHEQRLALRQQRSVALLEELHAKITQIASQALPSSKLAEACQYALNQWPRLKPYLENGRIEIDQNLCENAMRALAVESLLLSAPTSTGLRALNPRPHSWRCLRAYDKP